MFALSLLPLASLAISSVSGLVVPRKSAPETWATGYLEDYTVYHTRYLALSCNTQHNTEFFDQCCHPLLATENLQDNREAWCTPSASASASASAAEPTSTLATDDDDVEECEDDDSTEDDDTEEDCDDEEVSASAVFVAPATTYSPAAAPAPTSTYEAATEEATSSTVEPAPSSTAAPSSTEEPATSTSEAAPTETTSAGSGDVHTGGFATFFYQNGVAGACGTVHGDYDLVAAIDSRQYGDLGKQSDLCGKQVKITNPANKKEVVVTIADACPTCNNAESIDLSVGAFTAIATEAEGLVGIEWTFL